MIVTFFFLPFCLFGQQLPQDINEIGVPRRMVEVPLKGEGLLFVFAAGNVEKVSSGFDTIPFNSFMDSGLLPGGKSYVKVQELHGSLSGDPKETSYTDTYIDTFSLVKVYGSLLSKMKNHNRKYVTDYADNEVVFSKKHQKISMQIVSKGILLKWFFEDAKGEVFSQVILAPNGNLLEFKQKNAPVGYTAAAMVWHLGDASFGLW